MKFPTWQHKVVLEHRHPSRRRWWVRATAGLHYIQGNRRPYFSVTGEQFVPGNSDKWEGLTKTGIWQHFPGLYPVLSLHLSDDRGRPMHAVANGLYWLGLTGRWTSYDPAVTARLWRVAITDLPEIDAEPESLSIHPVVGPCSRKVASSARVPSTTGLRTLRAFMRERLPVWRAEARYAIAVLDSFSSQQEKTK